MFGHLTLFHSLFIFCFLYLCERCGGRVCTRARAHVCVCVPVWECRNMFAAAYMWTSKNSLWCQSSSPTLFVTWPFCCFATAFAILAWKLPGMLYYRHSCYISRDSMETQVLSLLRQELWHTEPCLQYPPPLYFWTIFHWLDIPHTVRQWITGHLNYFHYCAWKLTLL